MRRILLLAFLLLAAGATDLNELKLRIMESLVHIFVPGERPTVYFDTKKPIVVGDRKVGFRPVLECEKADVLFTDDIDRLLKLCRPTKRQFVLSLRYRDYIRHRDLAAGAFFWQKGRPNIVINSEVLKKRRIRIPEKYEKYVE